MLNYYFFQHCDAALLLLVSGGKPVLLILFGSGRSRLGYREDEMVAARPCCTLLSACAVLVASLFC